MKKAELARRLAKRAGVSAAEAADRLDRVVNGILTHLRQGETALLPGLGIFSGGRNLRFTFEPKIGKKPHGK